MKKFAAQLLTAGLVLGVSSVKGQTVYACQEVASIGWGYKDGRWEQARFSDDAKFFLKLGASGLLDTVSASRALAQTEAGHWFTCTNLAGSNMPNVHFCSGLHASLSFNSVTAVGAFSRLLGASVGDSKRDSISITRFSCQRM